MTTRGRGSERRAGSSGRASRSHSLESLEKRSADKVQVEDQSFANVMLSWRERIAADAARKASIDMAEAKPHSRSKSSTPVKHRSREVSPLQYDARDAGSTERRAGSRSPRPQASIEEYLFNNREENDALSRKVLSDAQEYSSHDEDKFKMVGRSKSDLQVSAASTEAVDAMDASLDKVSAQVSVVRNKRTSVKSSRSKDKHRASHPGDLNAKASSKSPSSGNTEASSSADQVVQDPILDLKDHKESSSALNSTAQEESLKIPDVDSRVTPKKRKTAEPVVMLEEEKPQLPRVVTPVVEVKGPSNEEEDFSTSVEVVPNPQVVPSAHSEQEQEEEDVKVITNDSVLTFLFTEMLKSIVLCYDLGSEVMIIISLQYSSYLFLCRSSFTNLVTDFICFRWKTLLTVLLDRSQRAFPPEEINVFLKMALWVFKGLTTQVQYQFLTAQFTEKNFTLRS